MTITVQNISYDTQVISEQSIPNASQQSVVELKNVARQIGGVVRQSGADFVHQ
jgi:hypothetical protein